jgi:hypothetical protein
MADAVDKVGDEQRAGNDRIQVPSFLNRYCAPDSYLDSMLLTRLSKNVYRQHRHEADKLNRALRCPLLTHSGNWARARSSGSKAELFNGLATMHFVAWSRMQRVRSQEMRRPCCTGP